MIKILFFDIDGTLLQFGKTEMTLKLKETLKLLHQRGIKLFLATGRPSFEIPSWPDVPFDGAICFNGSYCFDQQGMIYKNCLNLQDIKTVIQNATQLGHSVQAAGLETMMANRYEEKLDEYFKLAHQKLNVSNQFDDLIQQEIFQLMVACAPNEYPALLQYTTAVQAVGWVPFACDVIPKAGGKGIAIEKVLTYYGFQKEEAAAFGDGGNDIDMLQAVGMGIAMGNAKNDVKQAADWVTKSVDEDGIVFACKKLGLID